MIRNLYLCPVLLALCAPLFADVVQSSDSGFHVSNAINVDQDPAMIHRTLTAHIDQWWVASHTYTGKTANLYTEMEAGGGFYEKLSDGGVVEHLRLLYFSPGVTYRWDGALGPLQPMEVNGRLSWTITPTDEGHTIVFDYKVWGAPPGGLGGLAEPVDGMMKETIGSLEKRLSWD